MILDLLRFFVFVYFITRADSVSYLLRPYVHQFGVKTVKAFCHCRNLHPALKTSYLILINQYYIAFKHKCSWWWDDWDDRAKS